MSPELKSFLRTNRPGGLIFFAHNVKSPEQMAKLITDIRVVYHEFGEPPPLIGVDQEGGTVIRVKTQPPFPSARALARTNDLSLVERIGYIKGELLTKLGINLNFSPVLDLSPDDKDTFIGSRSFSGNFKEVAEYAKYYSSGLYMGGLIPVAKHFPGHAYTLEDSHTETPVRKDAFEKLQAEDLVPFKEFFNLAIPSGLMPAHIVTPSFDPNMMATYSYPTLTQLIKNSLGFKGIIITDDLDMKGAELKGAALPKRAENSLKAGADLVMIAWSPQKLKGVTAYLNTLISKDSTFSKLAQSKVERLISLRWQFKTQEPSIEGFYKEVKSEFFQDTLFEVAQKTLESIRIDKEKSKPRKIVFATLDSEARSALSRLPANDRFMLSKFGSSGEGLNHLDPDEHLIVYHIRSRKDFNQLLASPNTHLSSALLINTSTTFKVPPESFSAFLEVHQNIPSHPFLGYFVLQRALNVWLPESPESQSPVVSKSRAESQHRLTRQIE